MIFVDRLSFKSCTKAITLIWGNKLFTKEISIYVLDPIKRSLEVQLIKGLLKCIRIKLIEAKFYAGDMRTRDGENLHIKAQNVTCEISLNAAKQCIAKSKILTDLNLEWCRNNILLIISKYFTKNTQYGSYNHTIFKILIADVISQNKCENHYLIFELPVGFSPELFDGIKGNLNLLSYSKNNHRIRHGRLSILLLIILLEIKKYTSKLKNYFKSKPKYGDIVKPALLVLEGGLDLSFDRSYRTQPHWLFKEDIIPTFRTLVLSEVSSKNPYRKSDESELNKYGVYSIENNYIYASREEHSIKKKINKTLLTLFYLAFFGPKNLIGISFEIALLFKKASNLVDLCISQNIKAFTTCEIYSPQADAINLIGPHIGVHTMAYQFSNINKVRTTMMTNANTMISFSELFIKRWSNRDIHPERNIAMGYIFDRSFKLSAKRSKKVLSNLKAKGVKFIITYFDEAGVKNVGDKYGLLGANMYKEDFNLLSKLLLKDKTIGIICKCQFYDKNFTDQLGNNTNYLQAIKSKRYIELAHGKTGRNMVFPSEPAIISDIVIGHAIGATAGLEAVLAGSRCILLNPYNMCGDNIQIFKQADILYDNMESALKAIYMFRQGKSEYLKVGDWSPIINLFDPFRDGKASIRLREFLEGKIFG